MNRTHLKLMLKILGDQNYKLGSRMLVVLKMTLTATNLRNWKQSINKHQLKQLLREIFLELLSRFSFFLVLQFLPPGFFLQQLSVLFQVSSIFYRTEKLRYSRNKFEISHIAINDCLTFPLPWATNPHLLFYRVYCDSRRKSWAQVKEIVS